MPKNFTKFLLTHACYLFVCLLGGCFVFQMKDISFDQEMADFKWFKQNEKKKKKKKKVKTQNLGWLDP